MTDETLTDEQLIELDIPLLIRYGLLLGGPHRTVLLGDGTIAAALTVERYGVHPRSVAFLGEAVRRIGLQAASRLPEPLPGVEAAGTAREWLTTAASVAQGLDDDATMARWLEAVATVLALRQNTRQTEAG
ncbi:hypothetical protein ACQEVS_02625 [Streptomyces sp. CA-181903]|uniref:hypothetical protein n=1 Tax=Streptomyces sp. CA-181903 TaxID=3240055 RepID=UPI003D908A97